MNSRRWANLDGFSDDNRENRYYLARAKEETRRRAFLFAERELSFTEQLAFKLVWDGFSVTEIADLTMKTRRNAGPRVKRAVLDVYRAVPEIAVFIHDFWGRFGQIDRDYFDR